MKYEYGIKVHRIGEIHREGMTREQALEWVDGWLEDGGSVELFSVIRRSAGAWEDYFKAEAA